jgi:hypothetical protein
LPLTTVAERDFGAAGTLAAGAGTTPAPPTPSSTMSVTSPSTGCGPVRPSANWLALGVPVLPAVVDPAGVARFGVDALTWLAGLLPGRGTGARQAVRRLPVPANRIPAPVL